VHTIMTQPGPDAPGKCAGFTGPARPGGQCTRCGRPDYAHQAGGRERQARIGALDTDQMTMALTFLAGYSPPVLDAVLDATGPARKGLPGIRPRAVLHRVQRAGGNLRRPRRGVAALPVGLRAAQQAGGV
jgi:hypothetical protein